MKLTAQDLQIGDWVLYNDEPNIIAEVSEIIQGEADVCFAVSNYMANIDEIKPFPITPEILEKNGFKKILDEDNTECYRYYYSAADGYIQITLYDGLDGDWSIEVENYEKFDNNLISYRNDLIFLNVHQLQQAMRLCNIRKEIEP